MTYMTSDNTDMQNKRNTTNDKGNFAKFKYKWIHGKLHQKTQVEQRKYKTTHMKIKIHY